jgi:hypothetical protein
MNHHRTHRRANISSRGLALLDVMIGLSIAVLTLVMISQLLAQHHSAERAMAQRRAAMRQAEWVLTSLQLGKPVPKDVPCELVWLRDQAATNQNVWLRVRVIGEGGQNVSLVGQVPIASLGDEVPAEVMQSMKSEQRETGSDATTNVNEVVVRSTLNGGAK